MSRSARLVRPEIRCLDVLQRKVLTRSFPSSVTADEVPKRHRPSVGRTAYPAVTGRLRVLNEWRTFIEAQRREELDRIISEENLDPGATRVYIEGASRDGAIQQAGTEITRVLPPVSRFSPAGEHAARKQTVIGKLSDFFERFFGLS